METLKKVAIVIGTAGITVIVLFLGIGIVFGIKTSATDEITQEEISDNERIVSVSSEDMEKYIKLGQYQGLSLQEEVQDVTDKDINKQIKINLSQDAVETDDKDAQVEIYDVVNIDYKGQKDGIYFEGGTAEGVDLTVGSGSFINGFEDGLIGAKKGETRTLNLVYPENYQWEELAGQNVVFTVTVNAIKNIPKLTNKWIKENTEFNSTEQYKEWVRQELQETNKEIAKSAALSKVWDIVMDNCEVLQYPQDDLEKVMTQFENSLNEYAEQQSMEIEELLEVQGMTVEQFQQQKKEYAEYTVKQNLIVQAIMDKENFSFDDEETQKAQNELVENYGVENISELVEEFGIEIVKQSIALARVTDFVLNQTEVEFVESSNDDIDNSVEKDTENKENDAEKEIQNQEINPEKEKEIIEDLIWGFLSDEEYIRNDLKYELGKKDKNILDLSIRQYMETAIVELHYRNIEKLASLYIDLLPDGVYYSAMNDIMKIAENALSYYDEWEEVVDDTVINYCLGDFNIQYRLKSSNSLEDAAVDFLGELVGDKYIKYYATDMNGIEYVIKTGNAFSNSGIQTIAYYNTGETTSLATQNGFEYEVPLIEYVSQDERVKIDEKNANRINLESMMELCNVELQQKVEQIR